MKLDLTVGQARDIAAAHPVPMIEILHCADHDFWAIAVSEDGGGAQRMVGGKCCGRWAIVKRWLPKPEVWSELAGRCEEIAEVAVAAWAARDEAQRAMAREVAGG